MSQGIGDAQGLPWLVTVLAALLGGGGVWGWLGERAKLRAARQEAKAAAPADLATAYASFAKTLNDQAEAFIRALQEERGDLVRQVSKLRAEVDRLSQEHEACLGENRQLQQRIDSLERVLKLPGGAVVNITDGAVEVSTPETPR